MTADWDRSGFLEHIASADYQAALRKGFWRSVFSWLTQNNNELLPFDEVRKYLPLLGQYDIGLRQIPLDKIVGSVGRYQDFDRAFLPRQTHTKGRWVNIDKAHLQDIVLPPIEVYKVGEVYFVKDGNHRVSVARQRGQVFIDAYVTEIQIPVQLDADFDHDDLIRKKEQAEFLLKTGLVNLRPEAQIELTVPGYSRLLEHIETHRWFMREKYQRPIKWEEAVTSWYDEVYVPLVRVIREQNILEHFPNRTEGDLYLWIIEHLWYLCEEYKADVSPDEAAQHFAEEYSERMFDRILNIIRHTARILTGEEDAEIIPPQEKEDTLST